MSLKASPRLSGILLMIRAAGAFSVMALCVKFAGRSLPSGEIIFFRSLLGTLFIGSWIFRRGVSFLGRERGLMTLRAISGFLALSLHFYTITELPLGVAVLLNYTSPIFAVLFAVFFLKEKIGIFRWAMILLSFVGIYLLTGAGVHGSAWMIFLGLLSAMLTGVVFVAIRAIRRHESPLTIIFYFTTVSMIGSLSFLPAGFHWPNWQEWLLLIGIGIGSFYGQVWMTLSLRRAPASLVTPFSFLTPTLSFLYGFLFLGERLEGLQFLGTLLTILGGILIILRERPSRSSEAQSQGKAASPQDR